ncbi:MAG: hypothetical protein K0S12_659, partial [Bacteroidetes bacterium]|nr:hypothetical protein [Bacteroidota bacterium]
MKKIVFLFWIVAATPLLSQNKSVTISEGLAQGLLDYSAKGAWNANDKYEYTDANGQYYGKSIAIRIHNRSKEDLSIEVPAGLLMMSEDSVVQDMLVTQPMFATLGPRQTKHFLLYAMCSEIHDGVPNTAVNYFVGKMAPQDLV